MKKIFAILALGCLLFLTAGYHLLYHYRIAEAKQEMKKTLLATGSKHATRLVLSPDEFEHVDWENENEFSYKGEMYDVLRTEKGNDHVIVLCVSDEKETALIERYFKTQKQSSENSPANSLQKIITAQYLPPCLLMILPLTNTKLTFNTHFYFTLPQTEEPILTPPPQVC